jgi:DNA-binding SARP family transcriptional activator/predicted DCC family thiol-disulfide oxidoreductase YuxK
VIWEAIVEFRLLGPVEAYANGHRVKLGDQKHRLLLAVLLDAEGRSVSPEALIDRIWDDAPPRDPRAGLHKYVYQLRQYLDQGEAGAGELIEGGGGYRIQVDRNTVDLHRFRDLRAEARKLAEHDDGESVRLFREALREWGSDIVSARGGEPLAGLTGRWVEDNRHALREEYRAALLDCLEAGLRRGQHDELIPELVRLTRASPLDERISGLLALAYYRAERPADALAAIQATKARLADELATDPARKLDELYVRILRNDPSLDPPANGSVREESPDRDNGRRVARDEFADPVLAAPPTPGRPDLVIGTQLSAWGNRAVFQSAQDMVIAEPAAEYIRARSSPERLRSSHTVPDDAAFLIAVDVAAHSTVLVNNPRDLVFRVMDLLHERLTDRLLRLAERHRCGSAQLWRWTGDSGLLVVRDEEESVACTTAMEYVKSVLELDLAHLRAELASLGMYGDLHVRMGVHRGSVRYRGEGPGGAIYSPDISFAAHLEKIAPPDTAAVSGAVQQVAGGFDALLHPVGQHLSHPIYLFSPGVSPAAARKAWLATHGLDGARPVHAYTERPSQWEKSRLIAEAEDEVIDLGTALRTASRYLVTTERPTPFRNAVADLLRSGCRYRCVLMDPDAPATRLVAQQRGEDLPAKISQALADLRRFKDKMGDDGTGLEVHLTSAYPGMAAIAVDVDRPHGLILNSPDVMPTSGAAEIDRGDKPHYLVDRSAGALYYNLRDLIVDFARVGTRRVL